MAGLSSRRECAREAEEAGAKSRTEKQTRADVRLLKCPRAGVPTGLGGVEKPTETALRSPGGGSAGKVVTSSG